LTDAPQPRRCFAGQHWQWDGVRFDMLHPTWGSYGMEKLKDNYRGCVLKVTSAHGSLLLPADIEHDAEAELLERQPGALAADVLVAPHHGSKTSSTGDFLRRVHPSIAIFTVGYRNRFGHPKPDVVERYRDLGSHLYRSDADGAVLLEFGRNGIVARSWRQTKPRYWLAESEDAR